MRSASAVTTSPSRFVVLSLLTLALAVSCDRIPTTPSTSLPPQPPPDPAITRVELIAPGTLAPGETAQLRVVAHRSDGRTEDVTATASLHSSQPDVLAISPDAMTTALKLGESFVTATSKGYGNSQEIVVVPEGTFRVVGRVSEADTPSVALAEARVETDGGVPPVLTDSVGYFRFYGVRGNSRVRVTKPGYVATEVRLAIADHHTENIALALAAPRTDVSGTYHLTIEAPPACRTEVAEPLFTRRYAAQLTQNGAQIRGTLSGTHLAAGSSAFYGRVEPTRVVLDFVYDPYERVAGLLEIIDEATSLVISGMAQLTATDSGFAGGFSGSFLIFPSDPRSGGQPRTHCSGPSRVTLTR